MQANISHVVEEQQPVLLLLLLLFIQMDGLSSTPLQNTGPLPRQHQGGLRGKGLQRGMVASD